MGGGRGVAVVKSDAELRERVRELRSYRVAKGLLTQYILNPLLHPYGGRQYKFNLVCHPYPNGVHRPRRYPTGDPFAVASHLIKSN